MEKRRWFQFRLSTLVVVVIVASVLVWVNATGRQHMFRFQHYELGSNYRDWGWPFRFLLTYEGKLDDISVPHPELDILNSTCLLMNIAVAMAILVAVGVVSEFIARRRQ